MTQQLFDDLIGTPPPSTVDVDAIVRRKAGQRRLLHVGVTGLAVLAVFAAFSPLILLPGGDRTTQVGVPPTSAPASDPAISVGPSGGEYVRPDPDRFIDDAMRNWLRPEGAQWVGPPPHIELPPDGGTVTQARAGIVVGGRKGTLVVTVWPRGLDDASGCEGLERCTDLSAGTRKDCAQAEPDVRLACEVLSSSAPSCGRVDDAVRPALGLTRPGWELRCAQRGGRAVSILVTNQTGAPADPLPQPEPPTTPEPMLPIVTALLSSVQ